MIEKALEIARQTANEILSTAACVWGPTWVAGVVRVPGVDDVTFDFGITAGWKAAEWGDERKFREIARRKMVVADRLGMNTSAAAKLTPWLLIEGDYLYPGGAHQQGISCGVSGANGWADEAMAQIVIDCIVMLAHLEVKYREEHHMMQI